MIVRQSSSEQTSCRASYNKELQDALSGMSQNGSALRNGKISGKTLYRVGRQYMQGPKENIQCAVWTGND